MEVQATAVRPSELRSRREPDRGSRGVNGPTPARAGPRPSDSEKERVWTRVPFPFRRWRTIAAASATGGRCRRKSFGLCDVQPISVRHSELMSTVGPTSKTSPQPWPRRTVQRAATSVRPITPDRPQTATPFRKSTAWISPARRKPSPTTAVGDAQLTSGSSWQMACAAASSEPQWRVPLPLYRI
jgi:hypothetical protein